MAAREEVRAVIIGEDKASDAFSRVGRSATEMSAKMDAAAFKSALLDDALKRQRETARRTTDATLALAKSDEILNEVEHRLRDGALEAEFALKRETEAKKKSRDAALEAAAANKTLKDSFANRDWLAKLTGGSGAGSTGILGRIGNLFPGLAGTGGGASGLGALAPAAGGLANPYVLAGGAIVAAGVAPLLAQLVSGAAVLGLGGGLAGLGIAGALGTGKTVTAAQLQAAQLRLEAAQAALAKKNTPSAQAAVITAQQNLAQLQHNAQTPAQAQVRQAFKQLSNDAQDSLAQIGRSFVPVMQSVFTTADSVLKKLTPVFSGAEKVIAGPFKVFADTLLNAFTRPEVKASIGAVAGAFGKLLGALTPAIGYGASQIADGISRIARSVAEHPQAFADMVQGLFKLTGILLDGISALANFGGYLQQHFWPAMHRTSVIFDGVRHEVAHIADDMASALIRTWGAMWNDLIGTQIRFGHNVETQFNSVRHETAVIFDGVRHDTAHLWDMTWQNTIGRLNRGMNDSDRLLGGWEHNVAHWFDTARHDTASAWDTTWNNTVSRTARGVGDVTRWFSTLPGGAVRALGPLGSDLLHIGSTAISDLWNGLKAGAGNIAGGGILGWIAGFAHGIVDTFKKIWGWFSPSRVMYEGGKSLMQGLAGGLKDHAHLAMRQVSAVAGGVAGAGVQRWRNLVDMALGMEGLPIGLDQRVLYQMQTESGGNPNAQNNWDINAQRGDPSRGLLQTTGATFAAYHWPGTSWNIFDPLANIAAAINYARNVYGPALMSNGMGMGSGHGYAAGTMSAAPGWAWVGEHGPELMHFRGGEQVYPAHAAGGGDVHIHVSVPPTVNPREAGRQVADLLLAHTRHGGRLYPAGVTPR